MVPRYPKDPAESYGARFYSYGLFGLLDEWIRRDFRESPEQLAEMFRKMMKEQNGSSDN